MPPSTTTKEETNMTRTLGQRITEEITIDDFVCRKIQQGKWRIENLNGETLRTCRSKAECIRRIETQTV